MTLYQNRIKKPLVLVIESKIGFTWDLGILVKEMLSGICDELKIQSQLSLTMKLCLRKMF